MNRREFITLIGSVAAWPVVANAQQPAMPVIGWLGSSSPAPYANRVTAFRQGLNETGYVEGRNVAIEFGWARGDLRTFSRRKPRKETSMKWRRTISTLPALLML
jgi:putative ABC transport system substrate-binding protein